MSTSNGRDSSLLLLPPHQRVAYTLDFYATGHTKCNAEYHPGYLVTYDITLSQAWCIACTSTVHGSPG